MFFLTIKKLETRKMFSSGVNRWNHKWEEHILGMPDCFGQSGRGPENGLVNDMCFTIALENVCCALLK